MVDGTMNAGATETLDTSRLYLLACLPIPRQETLLSQDEELRSRLYDTVSRLAEIVTIGRLECRPDREAAELCYRRLKEIDNKNS